MSNSKRPHKSSVIVVLFAAILVASIVLNFFLYRQGRWYYLQLNATRLDPLGLGYYTTGADQQREAHSDQRTVVFFGDSRAANWPAPALGQFEFINRGIGSQTSAQAVLRSDYHVKPLQPQIIVVQVGINDLKTIPLFPEQKASIIANCKTNIQKIVEQSMGCGARVILTTLFPLGQVSLERRLFWSDDVAAAIGDVNQYIVSLKSENVEIMDTVPILAGRDGKTNPLHSQDLLHLNAKGYEALNVELVRILSP